MDHDHDDFAWRTSDRYSITVVGMYGDEPAGVGETVVLTWDQMKRLEAEASVGDLTNWLWGSEVPLVFLTSRRPPR